METNEEKAAHLCNLIFMALRDNEFHDEEKLMIIRIATRFGLSYSDFSNLIGKKTLEFSVPESIAERIQHLHDLVMVMMSDGKVRDEELKFLSNFIRAYGFNENHENLSQGIDMSGLKANASFESFMDTFGMITAEKLSSVAVDHDFRIKFPLYKAELQNLGPLPKALYIFFLIKDEDVYDLSTSENKELLCNIYKKIPYSDYNFEERIESLTKPDGYYNCNKANIKKAIRNILPENTPGLLDNYIIHGGLLNQPKRIPLDKNLIQIQPSI